jgi:hypothetical protein
LFGKTLPKQRITAPLSVKLINEQRRLLERFARLRGPNGFSQSPAGSAFGPPATVFRVGLTSADGIPARQTSGVQQLGYADDVSDVSFNVAGPGQVVLQTWGSQFDGYNLSQNAVASNTLCMFLYLEGIWLCGWEDCQSSGG